MKPVKLSSPVTPHSTDVESEAEVQVDPGTLERAQIKSVVATSRVEDRELLELLSELHSERMVHTWKGFQPTAKENVLGQMKDFEDKKRETYFFVYYGYKLDGSRDLVGIGTIASKIAHHFPFQGFPVISRGYIMKRYRNFRLYFPILRHRFDACRGLFRDIQGIHLGTANPRIIGAIKKGILGLDFSFVGLENFFFAGSSSFVHDYLWFAPDFMRDLRALSEHSDFSRSQASHQELLHRVDRFLKNEADHTDYLKLKKAIENVQRESDWSPLAVPALRMLMTFFASIPVVETEIIYNTPSIAGPERSTK